MHNRVLVNKKTMYKTYKDKKSKKKVLTKRKGSDIIVKRSKTRAKAEISEGTSWIQAD